MRSVAIAGLMLLMFSCGPDLQDCDSKADVLEGAWIVKEVYIDEQEQAPASYKTFRLNLEGGGEFERSQPAGFPDSGTWSLTNGENILELAPNISPPEDYTIESFDLRQLVLVLTRDSKKSGPSKIRYVLIPES